MLRSRGYTVADHRADNLVIITKGDVTNYFYIFGGKDERSQDLIQGITLAGVFFDEVALMPESFVNQATGRCSVDGSKYWFNCNPDGPYHWFKTEWIDKREEKHLLYLHFTMDDNLSLFGEKLRRDTAACTQACSTAGTSLDYGRWQRHYLRYVRHCQACDFQSG